MLLVALACLLSRSTSAGPSQDPFLGWQAFIEQEVVPERVFLHQRVRAVVRFGFEREFLDSWVIQPLRRELDVPALLEIGWWEGLPSLQPVEPSPDPDAPKDASLVLNGEVVHARRLGVRERDGKEFVVYELTRELIATRKGRISVGGPFMRFAYATAFEDDLFAGRVPVDREDELVSSLGGVAEVEVLGLPEEGRPLAFSDAVGQFSIQAEAEPRQVEVGESLTLTLRVEGTGNLAQFKVPVLEPIEGFRVLGVSEGRTDGQRVFTLDIAPRHAELLAIPSIPFHYFDPEPPAGYRSVRTEPIPLAVLPPLAELPAPTEVRAGKTPEPAVPDESPAGARPWWLLALLPLAWLIVSALRRRRAGTQQPEADPRSRAARAEFERLIDERGVDPGEALVEYLAARLGCTRAAVIGPDLSVRLEAAGAERELAARIADRLERLVGARFGGEVTASDSRGLRELVVELDVAFGARTNSH